MSESPSLDAGSRSPAARRVLLPVSSTASSAFPRKPWVGFRICPTNHDFSQGGISRLQIFRNVPASKFAHPPWSFLPLRLLPQGSWGFYVRAYCASLPPHTPDMLTVRIQAIGGTGTFTLPDFQPCRLLIPCSGDFAPGRGGLRQLLGVSLSPCCRFHPAEVGMPHRSDFGIPCYLRPPMTGSALGSCIFEATSAFTVVTAR